MSKLVQFLGGYVLCIAGAVYLLRAHDLLEAIASLLAVVLGYLLCFRVLRKEADGR